MMGWHYFDDDEDVVGEDTRLRVVREVLQERKRQDEKWGEQNHPSVLLPVGAHYDIADEESAKEICDERTAAGIVTWTDVALEEFVEAMHAKDDAQRRYELVQLAAVIVAWVECIDRGRARAARPDV